MPPVPHGWRYETELYDGPNGPDLSAKEKFRRWRRDQRVWARHGGDGGLMLAVHKDDPDRVVQRQEVELGRIVGSGDDADTERHRELEVRLRAGPWLGDGARDRPFARFPLTLDEWRELEEWREVHGWGADFGSGPLRRFWRPMASVTVTRRHRLLPTLTLLGRAL